MEAAAAAAGVQLGSSKPQIVTQLGSSADPRQVPRGVRAAVRPPRAGPIRDGGSERLP